MGFVSRVGADKFESAQYLFIANVLLSMLPLGFSKGPDLDPNHAKGRETKEIRLNS